MSLACLLPLGSVEDEVLVLLEHKLNQIFNWEIRRCASLAVPVSAFNAVRNQYEALHLMRAVAEVAPVEAVRVLAVTEEDLSIPMLTFVYGQAQLGGKIAIMSLARLRQEFYGIPANKDLLMTRTIKEALHELGHTFGLVHCPSQACVMTLANDILHVDTKNEVFCGGCAMLLKDALHLNKMNAEKEPK